jgi:hypothetical protein
MFPRPDPDLAISQTVENARSAEEIHFSPQAQAESNVHANEREDCRYCRQAIRVEQPFEPLTLRENLFVWALLIGGTAGLAIAAVKAFS